MQMKKFKKPLTIMISQQDNNQVKTNNSSINTNINTANNFNANNQTPYICSPVQKKKCQLNNHKLLPYNEHTVTSSVNNQDEQQNYYENYYNNKSQQPYQENQQYEQEQNQLQINIKNNKMRYLEYQNKINTGIGVNKNNKQKKYNVVEFEEFNIQEYKQNIQQNQQINIKKQKNTNIENQTNQSKINIIQTIASNNTSSKSNIQKDNRKKFSIQIPQNQQNQFNRKQATNNAYYQTNNLKSDVLETNNNKTMKKDLVKQPPGPSNRINSTNLNKHFVFPIGNNISNQNYQKQATLNYQNKFSVNSQSNEIAQFQKINQKLNETISQLNSKLFELSNNFEKQRQQFYKQKSNLQKDLMIKEGQIQMLQKLITNRYSPKQSFLLLKNKPSYNDSDQKNLNNVSIYSNNLQQSNNKKSSHQKQKQKIQYMQTILLEKDLKMTQLFQKINEIHKQVQLKNTQIQENKISIIKLQNINESLKNQLFIFQRKSENQKKTKEFYHIKQSIYHNNSIKTQNSQLSNALNRTPKVFSRHKNQQIQDLLQNSKQKQKKIHKHVESFLDRSLIQYPMRGIDDLHRRLESLKMNRIQLQNRGKIKSQVAAYSQTTKYKPKGSFDFKGKFYDQKDYINHNRLH